MLPEEIPPTTETSDKKPSLEDRLVRLERTVFWHNVGWGVVATLVVGYLIPPVGGMIGLVMWIVLIGGGMIWFIGSIMRLLDRTFPDTPPKS